MASSSLLALIDDIATLLDDVAAMSKVAARQGAAAADDVAAMTQLAAKKTAGVLGDDLALNAQQVTGVTANRELPVVWAVAKGSLLNKAILVPAALLISWVAPWAITPLLMLGGLFLCFEGCEKLAHAFLHVPDAAHQPQNTVVADVPVDLVVYESEKVKGAIRTDFILSAEIVVITLGTVAMAPVEQRVAVLVGISVLMTVGVYGSGGRHRQAG
jgi:predicted DNA repair protein MutK